MSDFTRQLASFVSSISFESIPSQVIHESKRMLLDAIGCAVGGWHTDSGRIGVDYVEAMGGEPMTTMVGSERRTSPIHAAYANTRLGAALDADDTFPSLGHFGNTTVFSALAMAEHLERNGEALLAGIAVGFDVGARICNAIGLPFRMENGKVAGYTDRGGGSASIGWAAVGAATSVARLPVEQTAHAFGTAGANVSLPTLKEWSALSDLPMMKVADAGWLAYSGVASTLLAARGSTGYSTLLDGKLGFWRYFGGDELDHGVLLDQLGGKWLLPDTTYKPWPSCRWIHYPLTAFAQLIEQHHLNASDIERIVVRANPFSLSPRFHVRQPSTIVNAQFSYAHSMAMLALRVPIGPLWYSQQSIEGAEVQAIRDKVEVQPEPRAADLERWIQGGQFRNMPGGVDVHAAGRVLSATVDSAWGDPWTEKTRLSDMQLQDKFIGMFVSNDPRRQERMRKLAHCIIATVWKLEELSDIRELTTLLGSPDLYKP